MSIKNDGHYFCGAGGNRPDGLNEPVTLWFAHRCRWSITLSAATIPVYLSKIFRVPGEVSGQCTSRIIPASCLITQAVRHTALYVQTLGTITDGTLNYF
ncbi:hypothetical protein DO481_25245 [Salmonella enterica]|nr:hypothetical protein [Salmonella enterica]